MGRAYEMGRMDTKWLLSRLEQRNETIASLARAVGRDRAAMSRIVNGDQPLQLWMTPIIADKLGVTETELLSRTGELHMPVLSAAPIIPWHSVGAFAMTTARIEVSVNYERVFVPIASDTLIALKVNGDAMSALFPEGSIVAVDYAEKELHDNDIGVFAIEDRCVLRRFHTQRRRSWLTAEKIDRAGSEEPVGDVVGRIVSVPVLSRHA